MRKKYWSGWLIVPCVLFVSLPYLFGFFIKTHYDKTLAILSDNTKVELRVIQYHRHWFSSDVTLLANPALTDTPLNKRGGPQENNILIKQKIYHGPFIFSLTPSFNVRPALAFIRSFSDETQVLAQTTVKLNASSRTHIRLENYVLCKKNSTTLFYVLKGLQGDIEFNPFKNKFLATISCQEVYANIDNHPRHIKNFSAKHQLTRTSNGLWLGLNDYDFGQLAWQQADTLYTFNHFRYNTKSYLDHQQRFHVDVQGQVKSVIVNTKIYGPQEVSLNIDDLAANSLKKLQDIFPLSQAHLASHEQFFAAKEQFVALLSEGANFKINQLTLSTSLGNICLRANLHCPIRPNLSQLADLVKSTDGHINVKISPTLAFDLLTQYYRFFSNVTDPALAREQTKKTLAQWQNANWLVNDNSAFLFDFHWKDDRVSR